MVEKLTYIEGGTPIPLPSLNIAKPRKNLSRLLFIEIKTYNSGTIVGIYGKTGAGKSIYAMKVAYEFIRDWDQVLKFIVFTPFDFQQAVDYLQRNNIWIPILIWDDAGIWMELLKRTSWHPMSIGIRGAFETLRVNIGAVLMTMTSEYSLPRNIKNNGNLYKFRVRMIRNGTSNHKTPQSIAEIQVRRERYTEWGKFYWDSANIYVDHIVLRTPNYNEYEKIRNAYLNLYTKLIMASREIGPSKIMDYIYEEWKKLKQELKWRAFYEE